MYNNLSYIPSNVVDITTVLYFYFPLTFLIVLFPSYGNKHHILNSIKDTEFEDRRLCFSSCTPQVVNTIVLPSGACQGVLFSQKGTRSQDYIHKDPQDTSLHLRSSGFFVAWDRPNSGSPSFPKVPRIHSELLLVCTCPPLVVGSVLGHTRPWSPLSHVVVLT